MHVRLGDPIRIIQFTNYPFDRIVKYLVLIYVSVFLVEHQRTEQPHIYV